MKRAFFSALVTAALMLPWASTALAQHADGHGSSGRLPSAAAQLNAGQSGAAVVTVRPFYTSGVGWGYGPWYPYYGYGYGWGYGYGYGPVMGGIRLQVKPKTAEVFVDGYYAGTVRKFDGFFEQLDLVPGGHNIEIRAPGFEPLTFTTYARLDHTTDYKAYMVPINGANPGGANPSSSSDR